MRLYFQRLSELSYTSLCISHHSFVWQVIQACRLRQADRSYHSLIVPHWPLIKPSPFTVRGWRELGQEGGGGGGQVSRLRSHEWRVTELKLDEASHTAVLCRWRAGIECQRWVNGWVGGGWVGGGWVGEWVAGEWEAGEWVIGRWPGVGCVGSKEAPSQSNLQL